MLKENRPLLSDEFLDEIAKEINQESEGRVQEQREQPNAQ
ncbi:hypothetical protein [Mesobacillus subterraneus]|nr:hypothetical protein [Mesobacillus subterraneus]